MSELHVEVVRLGPIEAHPNADTLMVTKVFDYTVVIKRGLFSEGDLAVYVPVDAVVPDTDAWHWLAPTDAAGKPKFVVGQVPEKYRRIDAKKIRGTFSQGYLAALPAGDWQVGDNLLDAMGITKYEPAAEVTTHGETEKAPHGWFFQTYTDLEGMRRYPDIIQDGEGVVVTEKIHGANARYVHDGSRLWVGSRTQIKRKSDTSLWWSVAQEEGLEEKLAKFPMHIFFGEVYGQVQDLKYGVKSGAKFCCFDVFDVRQKKYLDFHEAADMANRAGLQWAPVLHVGPWSQDLMGLCEGKSTIADNVREGFVVRPLRERWHEAIGRVILKRPGEGYYLRNRK